MKWSAPNLWKAIGALLIFAAAGAIAFYEHEVVDPAFERVTVDFQNVAMADLPSIRLSPAAYATLVTGTVELPPERTAEFLAFLRDAKPFPPNHPSAIWECQLALSTRRENFLAKISATSNNGLLIYLKGGATLRCDPLRKYLEGIARPQPQTVHERDRDRRSP